MNDVGDAVTRSLTPLLAVLALTACQPKTADAPASDHHSNWFSGAHPASGGRPRQAAWTNTTGATYFVGPGNTSTTWTGPIWFAGPTWGLAKTCIMVTGDLSRMICQEVQCAPGFIQDGPNTCKPGAAPSHCLSRTDRAALERELREVKWLGPDLGRKGHPDLAQTYREVAKALRHTLAALPECRHG